MATTYILEIGWDRNSTDPVLPPLVGPFEERPEAVRWAHLNIPNGSWEVRPLAAPYADPQFHLERVGDDAVEWRRT